MTWNMVLVYRAHRLVYRHLDPEQQDNDRLILGSFGRTNMSILPPSEEVVVTHRLPLLCTIIYCAPSLVED